MGTYTDTYTSTDKVTLMPWLVNELAVRRNVTDREAFAFLYQHKAWDFYDRCYGVLHTFSIEEIVDDLEEYCNKHKLATA